MSCFVLAVGMTWWSWRLGMEMGRWFWALKSGDVGFLELGLECLWGAFILEKVTAASCFWPCWFYGKVGEFCSLGLMTGEFPGFASWWFVLFFRDCFLFAGLLIEANSRFPDCFWWWISISWLCLEVMPFFRFVTLSSKAPFRLNWDSAKRKKYTFRGGCFSVFFNYFGSDRLCFF